MQCNFFPKWACKYIPTEILEAAASGKIEIFCLFKVFSLPLCFRWRFLISSVISSAGAQTCPGEGRQSLRILQLLSFLLHGSTPSKNFITLQSTSWTTSGYLPLLQKRYNTQTDRKLQTVEKLRRVPWYVFCYVLIPASITMCQHLTIFIWRTQELTITFCGYRHQSTLPCDVDMRCIQIDCISLTTLSIALQKITQTGLALIV